jgi:ribonuclease HI
VYWFDLFGSVVDISVRHQFFSSSLDDWIAMNVVTKNGKNTNDDWSNYWAMACHHAWTWRNKENHDAEFLRPIRQPEFVRQRLKCYSSADRVMQDVVHQQKTIIHVGWNPPLQGWVCLNVDGASRNGVIGCGGVVRGSVGEWIHGFSKIIGRGEIYIAELSGVLEGMRLTRRMNFDKVEVRIDSLGIVKDINRKQASKMCGRALIRKIVDLLEHDWEVIFKHSYREANHLADALAKHNFLVKDDISFFQDCSGFCKQLLDADEQGITTPRSVSL